jgi:hypothetical protein
MAEQGHQPLAYLSGEIKGAQKRWKVPENENIAIVVTVTIMKYLLLIHDEFSNLFDHLKLTCI